MAVLTFGQQAEDSPRENEARRLFILFLFFHKVGCLAMRVCWVGWLELLEQCVKHLSARQHQTHDDYTQSSYT